MVTVTGHILPLIVQIAIIQIGPVPEHRQSQGGNGVLTGCDVRTGQNPNFDHAPLQSGPWPQGNM